MRSIPGTITQYVAGQDQVELLDLTGPERDAKIKALALAEAQRKANEAAAEVRRIEREGV